MNSRVKTKKIKKAVILAGGLGTRFLPATLAIAKELFPICEKPILLYHLEDLVNAGINDILIVGTKLKENSFKSLITPSNEYLDKIREDNKLDFLTDYYKIMNKVNFHYINQESGAKLFSSVNGTDDDVKGSSIAILASKEWSKNEPFLVLNGDDFCDYIDGKSVAGEIIELYNKTNNHIVLGRKVDINEIYKYSSIELGDEIESGKCYTVKDIVEKPKVEDAKSNIMGFARYIFKSDIYDEILKSKPRGNGEYCITDVISTLAKKGDVSTNIFTGSYFDCGNRLGFQMAGIYTLMKDKDNRKVLVDEFETINNLVVS